MSSHFSFECRCAACNTVGHVFWSEGGHRDQLRAHAEWTHATKLLGTFGESLAQWVDDDGRLRGQLKVGGTVTLRH